MIRRRARARTAPAGVAPRAPFAPLWIVPLGYAVLLSGAPPVRAYPDAPPPGFSGGFGEASCHACHFAAEPNQEPGRASILGVPERYAPGKVYPVTVELTRPAMALGGFQLTARFDDGGLQAGFLAVPAGAEERLRVAVSDGVQYAHHRWAGTKLVATDTARWVVLWTAPAAGGRVRFHVAATAADGDDSIRGDFVYTAEAASDAPE